MLKVLVAVGGGGYSTVVHCKVLQVVTVCVDTRPKEGRDMSRRNRVLVVDERGSIPCVNVRLLA